MNYLKKHPVVAGVALLVLILIGLAVVRSGEEVAETELPERLSKTSLLRVGDYQGSGATIQTVGEVESEFEVELRAEVNERVSQVFVDIGDEVSAGQLLLSLEDSELRAQLAQARAGLRAEQAVSAEVARGGRAEDIAIAQTALENATRSVDSAREALANAQDSAATSLNNLYLTVPDTLADALAKSDDAMRKQIDELFVENNSTLIELSYTTADTQAQLDAELGRKLVLTELDQLTALVASLGTSEGERDQALVAAAQTLSVVIEQLNFLQETLDAPNSLSATTLATYRTNVNTARTNINAAQTSVNGLQQSIAAQRATNESTVDAARAALTTAENARLAAEQQLTLVRAGASTEQRSAQVARVEASAASVANLEARLRKTQITSPISGTVGSIPLRTSDFASVGTLLVKVVNPSGFQVTTHVNPDQAALLSVGDTVVVDSEGEAVISRLSPTVDLATGKVEVELAVTKTPAGMASGQLVSTELMLRTQGSNGPLLVPLSAVKTTLAGGIVYVLNTDGVAEALTVALGRIIGTDVEILDGLTEDQEILLSIRDIEVGDRVDLNTDETNGE